MPKKQRSLLLDEDIAALVDAHQVGTGATFTRVVTAALIQYLFSDLEKPDPRWMRLAVALEREDITIDALPKAVAQDLFADLERRLETAQQYDGSIQSLCHYQRGYLESLLAQWTTKMQPAQNAKKAAAEDFRSQPYRYAQAMQTHGTGTDHGKQGHKDRNKG